MGFWCRDVTGGKAEGGSWDREKEGVRVVRREKVSREDMVRVAVEERWLLVVLGWNWEIEKGLFDWSGRFCRLLEFAEDVISRTTLAASGVFLYLSKEAQAFSHYKD